MSFDDKNSATQSKQSAVENVKADGNITIGDIVQLVIQISLPWFQPRFSRAEKEKSSRETLLNRVKDFWFSEQSYQKNIKLRLQDRYDCDLENTENRDIPFTTVGNIFDRWGAGNCLLILGEAGVGKTTTLLELAQYFWKHAKKDVLNHKLPVVLNLSSWGDRREPIAKWLFRELKTKYRIDKLSAKIWIQNQQIVLLLDGLNEVNKEHRSACIQEINQFMQNYGNTEIIVCSRIEVYKNLDERLIIEHTVLVQPLTSEQISQYLQKSGEEGNTIKRLLQEDDVLGDLARTPLIIYVMKKTHQKLPREGSFEKRRWHIFNAYIEENFKRELKKKNKQAIMNQKRKYNSKLDKYQEKHVRIWLKWLADKMSNKSITIFLIEEMQPSWLDEVDKKAYRKKTTWHHGIFFGFLFGTAYGAILHFYLHYFFQTPLQILLRGVFFGMVTGIIVGPAATFFLKVYELDIETYGEVEFSWVNYLKNLLKNTSSAIGIGLSVFLCCCVIMPILGYNPKQAVSSGLIAGVFFAIVTVISRATGDSFINNSFYYKNKNIPVRPNQGIWDSLSHTLAIAIISTVSIGTIYMVIIVIIHQINLKMFILGLCVAVFSGFVCAIISPIGKNCELHYALRFVLERNNRIPHNYADFLDYATQLNFMKKIGGGYKFYHELLQDHFKEMDG